MFLRSSAPNAILTLTFTAILASLALGGCGTDTGNTGTGGNLLPDANGTVDSGGAAGDTGAVGTDSGATGADTGAATGDTGAATTDGAVVTTDATTSADSTVVTDAGTSPDAGTSSDAAVTQDAGSGSDATKPDGTSGGGSCAAGDCKYVSGNSCQCDSYCESAGDCCADYAKYCKKPDCKTDTDCDDKNACTKDTCEGATTCKHEPTNEAGACDDGRVCSDDDKCTKGACKGTNKPTDSPCDDDKVCTEGDKCSSLGNCYGVSKDCDDGKPCTTDSCDAKTGTCGHEVKKDTSYCSDDNPCTSDTTCKAGTCSGPQNACDDDNPCTMDSCTKKTTYSKECKNAAMAAGAACDDGDPCTAGDACADGKCASKPSGKCKDALQDSFACGSNGSWVFAPASDDAKKVVGWGIDDTPAAPVAPSPKCSLNFNNGTDFDAKDAAGKSIAAKGTATSAEIDLSTAAGAKMTYQSYFHTETSSLGDWFYVEVSVDDFKSTAKSWKLTKNNADLKKWVTGSHDLTPWAGKKIKLRFRFDSGDTITNTGAGWFVDDLKVEMVPK